MTTVTTLRGLFSQRTKDSRIPDSDLAALAKLVLSESDGVAFADDAEQHYKNIAAMTKEALVLLPILRKYGMPRPNTLRVLLDALLRGWAEGHDGKLERKIADTLLALDKLEDKEKGQLDEALRQCAKEHLNYQPKKLLRILVDATDEHNETVVHWAFRTLTRTSGVSHLRFAARCLLACGEESDNPPNLVDAATHHIEAAAKTLKMVKRLRFADVRGGPHQPMDGTLWLRTATLADYVWVTSNMGEKSKEDSEAYANEWLDAAEIQLQAQLGPRNKRGFDVDLIVKVYPYVHDWFGRREQLEPLYTFSRTV